MFKSIFKSKFLFNLYLIKFNIAIVGFDHLNKNISTKFRGIKLEDKWKFIISLALEIIKIIIMLLKLVIGL